MSNQQQPVYYGRSHEDRALDHLSEALDYAREISYSRADSVRMCVPIGQLNTKANAIKSRAEALIESMDDSDEWLQKVGNFYRFMTFIEG